jgi:hypothetical protein
MYLGELEPSAELEDEHEHEHELEPDARLLS